MALGHVYIGTLKLVCTSSADKPGFAAGVRRLNPDEGFGWMLLAGAVGARLPVVTVAQSFRSDDPPGYPHPPPKVL